jgi:Leucine-rich repeat (LRR) protein
MNIKILNISSAALVKLPPLPKGLEILYCHDNQLNKLGKLPKSLSRLDCEDNPLKVLPQFPKSLYIIWISPWQLISCLKNLKDSKTKIRIKN